MPEAHEREKTTNIGRRSFLKWAGAVGGAAALGSTSLLTGCSSETQAQAVAQDESGEPFVGNTNAALSDGLPYGADKVVRTICTCGDVCGGTHVAQCYVKDGQIVYYEGCPEARSKGGLCPRGMAGMSIINNPNRIKYPMRRTNEKGVEGEFERISWDEAYDAIVEAMATAIEEEGPQTLYGTNYHPGNTLYAQANYVFDAIWNADSSYAPAACFSDLMIGCETTLGDMYHFLEKDPFESKVILSWGENDAVAKPTEYSESLRKAQAEHGAYWIQVEPRLSETGLKADLYLPVRPGTDAYLALAMANVIITEGLQDQEFIDKHTYGYEEFRDLVMKYDPETVEKITWTPADKIRQAARIYATSKPGMICIGRGGNQTGGDKSNSGWLMSRAITCLIGLTGNIGVKGSGLSMEQSNNISNGMIFHWPTAVVISPHTSKVKPLVERKPGMEQGGMWGVAKHIIEREPYSYRVWFGSVNSAGSCGNTAIMDEALKKVPMLIEQNRLNNWTGSGYGDILIPICSWAEEYVWRYDWECTIMTEPAIEPMFESISDFAFFKELSTRLARRLGFDESQAWPWDNELDFLAEMTNDVFHAEIQKRVEEGRTEFEPWLNCTPQDIIDSPTGCPNPFDQGLPEFIPFKAKYYPEQTEGVNPEEIWFPTAAGGDYPGGGKLLFRCDWVNERSGGVLPAMPVPEEPWDPWYANGNPVESGDWTESENVKNGYDLVACGKAHTHWSFISFNQGADGRSASAWLREAFKNAEVPCVEMNPEDAEARGLKDGDQVTVESVNGKQEGLTLVVTERAMPGVIVPPCHWGKLQCAIYPYSMSLNQLDEQYKQNLNSGGVGVWGAGTAGGKIGGQNVQSGVLCKVYKYEG